VTDDRLRLLLGPDGPELTCEECFAELPRYVELEAFAERDFEPCHECGSQEDCTSRSECSRMRAHLEGCPACREERDVLVELVTADLG
jgi:hypothetical protein